MIDSSSCLILYKVKLRQIQIKSNNFYIHKIVIGVFRVRNFKQYKLKLQQLQDSISNFQEKKRQANDFVRLKFLGYQVPGDHGAKHVYYEGTGIV